MHATSLYLCYSLFTWARSPTQAPTHTLSLSFFPPWLYMIKWCQRCLWHNLFWHKAIQKSSLSYGNVTTCSPRGQINLLVIAHLNISDNSFNINNEFYSFPRFRICTAISIPLLKSYKDLEPARIVYFKENLFLQTPFWSDLPYYSDFLSHQSGNFQCCSKTLSLCKSARLCHCVNLTDRDLENIQTCILMQKHTHIGTRAVWIE